MPHYRLESDIAHARADVFDWHLRDGAFDRLTPPWADVRVLEKSGGPEDLGRVVLQVKRGPLSVRWVVVHTAFEPGKLFQDEQESGPFSTWIHKHEFSDTGAGHTHYVDDVEWELPASAISELALGTSVERELDRMFRFRHLRLARDLELHSRYGGDRLRVAVTGASGFLGTLLTSFLTTGGHDVVRLVRRKARADDEVMWDPDRGTVDTEALGAVDAVVHLAGESISGGRWSRDKKRAIMESRVRGTQTLVRALGGMSSRPSVLVSASAIGIYGNRRDEVLDVSSKTGQGFLPDVCRAWEGETRALRGKGVRVVNLRLGLVLSPAGGALGTMILPFKMGVGGRLGSGRQYVSWIDADDAVGMIMHAIRTPDLEGPINGTAPHPVTNATFTTTLGRVLGRPTLVPVPKFAVRTMFGEMGERLLLEGQRVLPRKVLDSGFRFQCEALEDSLRYQLGELEDAGPS